MRISDWSSDVCSSDLVEALPLAVAPPQFIRRWKLIEGQLRLDLVTGSGAVMEQEAVAVAGEHEGHVERFGIVERLLHAGADAVFVVLGLDDRQPQVGLAIQDEVGAPRLAAAVELAADDHPTLGEADFFADLVLDVPASRLDSGGRSEEHTSELQSLMRI